MKTTLNIVQIILSLILIILVFLQSGNTDESRNYLSGPSIQKRGWEKIMFTATIITLIIFLILSIVQTVI